MVRRAHAGPRAVARLIAAPICAALGLLGAASGSAGASPTVKVWFLQGEQMISVKRPGSTVKDAISQLLAGPTADERKRGIRTYVPAGTTLLDVSVANRVAVVDLAPRFIRGTDGQSRFARLSQVVFSATGPEGAAQVRVEIQGKPRPGLVEGVDTAAPMTVKKLSTPSEPVPQEPQAHSLPVVAHLFQVQDRLVELGYLPADEVDGENGPATQAAVLAFQKWEGLTRDGVIGPQTLAALQTAQRPTPITQGGPGKRIEVLLDRQVALAIEDDQVVRVIHVSTGAPATPTPPGDYRVYQKLPKWWSVPFREWLLWALPFDAGIGIHEFAPVPVVAASHGCVRNTFATSKWIYDFAEVGMPVKVIANSG